MVEKRLKGMTAFPGNVSGRAFILTDRDVIPKLKNGEILVAECTYPAYLPVMLKAKAMVTEVGGILCHSAIVAREFKIPCVVGVDGLMDTVKDGDIITIKDGEIIVKKA